MSNESRENALPDRRRWWPMFTPGGAMWATVWGLSAVGVIAIVFYAWSVPGHHMTYIGTGVLTAFAAGLSGSFFGFLLGIPRVVSSGEARQVARGTAAVGRKEQARLTTSIGGAAPGSEPTDASTSTASATLTAPANPREMSEGAARFAQSTNLAEISDWLTKLLLGAGLVSLTKLGQPTSHLFHTVAGGLAVKVDGAALLMAGAIVVTYVAIGFMATYIGTTVWYTKLLETAA